MPGAELADDVEVGAYCVIGAGVRDRRRHDDRRALRDRRPHDDRAATTASSSSLARRSAAGQEVRAASRPRLEIGDRNTIREFCTFNRGTAQDAGVTRVGDDNWIMAYVHIAHDCQVGNHTILANNATLAGHVQIGDWVILGGCSGVHQFCKIGAHAMTGFQSHVSQDVPPFMMVAGNPLAVRGINAEGLRRRGFSRRAHRAGQADAPAAVPRRPDAGRGAASAIAALPAATPTAAARRRR